jgi:hypothetical protein
MDRVNNRPRTAYRNLLFAGLFVLVVLTVFTVGYRMAGIPDGLGAYDNGNGTFTVLMNHELGNTAGDVRAHGSKGAYVSDLTIDKATLSVLGGHARAVYKASMVGSSGLLEVLCLGPRSDSAVYDMAVALRDSGLLDESEITDLWDALAVLDVVAEDVGLDGWDYAPPPAPDGMVRAVVAQGLLDEEVARVFSADELQEAMAEGWGPEGPDPHRALIAALERARRRSGGAPEPDPATVITARSAPRCGVVMPRAGVTCIRRAGHPGPHRAS